ncbi:hypothetical protein BCR36DRAFT_364896 [Piromyces finnis]|uniref:TAFII55 protein conserved region domain-containing protein n=1 Tax=Piromyces finnis TaxID=1754191 RepID=A0A1Y1UPI6_9FUNG|nr:hypothetical protein BCR36DRAFT_364896 [Piromyces finnis]|eukprot:ORX39487.1 hypothetical protein BCR36DRAFT_364896 [Piromyces finnis]
MATKKLKARIAAENDINRKIPVKRILLKRGNADNQDKDDDENNIHYEEQFLLRMPEGDANDRLRQAIQEREVPEEFKITFSDSRHATIHWENENYNAKLVDLPCIIESQKTLDRKQFYKIADISQILIATKEKDLDIDYSYPHGISAPLKYVRKRRFRKRMSKRVIEDVEREVERLLQDDANAEDVTYDFGLNMPDKIQEESDIGTPGPTSEGEEEMEGEVEGDADMDMDNLDLDEESLAADIEQQLDQNDDNEDEDSEEEASGDDEGDGDGDEGDEDGEGDEEGDEGDEEEDDQEESLQQKRELIQEEIDELEAKIEEKNEQIKSVVGNQIMKKRFVDQLHALEKELEEKQNEMNQIE